MNAMNDGGPAFPRPTSTDEHAYPCNVYDDQCGMSLRDYFAAKAMHAELVTCGVPGQPCDAMLVAAHKTDRTPEAQMAWNAYQMADAMLAAREVTP